ncbi:hypothetical protein EIK77_007466 [Talaromyces pinophilus]|nr:hypothetical protein EIK77_007466 [Talaromyces pinophilus]
MAEKSTSRDAGIAYLDEQISESYEGDETYELANILKHLLAENGITPQETAQQIDSFYEDKFVPSQPIFQKEKSIGMINLLGALDELLCNLGRDECTVYKDDPIFGVLVHECWNMYFVHRQTPGTPSEVQESCDQYVNLSSFIARCTSAGLLVDKHGNEYKYSTFDVSRGVEEEIPRGNIRNARILAAANYILLAGSGIRNYCHSYPSDSDRGKSARDMWNLWKEKFVAIAEGQDEDPEIKDATKKAHAIMVELDASGHDVESTS